MPTVAQDLSAVASCLYATIECPCFDRYSDRLCLNLQPLKPRDQHSFQCLLLWSENGYMTTRGWRARRQWWEVISGSQNADEVSQH